MNQVITILLLLIANHVFFSQNLVSNSSFEVLDDTIISRFNAQLNYGDQIVEAWTVPTDGTADFYNGESKHKKSRTGKGRIGLVTFSQVKHKTILTDYFNFPISELKGDNCFSEYIRTKLTKPLVKGQKYCVKFYASSGSGNYFSSLGFLLTEKEIKYKTSLQAIEDSNHVEYEVGFIEGTPSYSSGIVVSGNEYVEVSSVYLAKGGEQYLTIGNFDQKAIIKKKKFIKENPWIGVGSNALKLSYSMTSTLFPTAIYYIDDVSVVLLDDEDNACDNDETIQLSEHQSFIKANSNYNFLIDASNSMNSYKQALYDQFFGLHNLIKKNDFVNVFSFNSDVKHVYSDTSDLKIISKEVYDIEFKGSTQIYEALEQTFNYVYKNKPPSLQYNSYVILITDGDFVIDRKIKKLVKDYADLGLFLKVLDISKNFSKPLNKLCVKNKGLYKHIPKQIELKEMI